MEFRIIERVQARLYLFVIWPRSTIRVRLGYGSNQALMRVGLSSTQMHNDQAHFEFVELRFRKVQAQLGVEVWSSKLGM